MKLQGPWQCQLDSRLDLLPLKSGSFAGAQLSAAWAGEGAALQVELGSKTDTWTEI